MTDLNTNIICRVCLQPDPFLLPIFEEYNELIMAKVITEFTGLIIEPDDNLPQQVCNCCTLKLIDAYQIRLICINSDLYLRQRLVNISNIKNEQDIKIDELQSITDVTEWKENDTETTVDAVVSFDYFENDASENDNDRLPQRQKLLDKENRIQSEEKQEQIYEIVSYNSNENLPKKEMDNNVSLLKKTAKKGPVKKTRTRIAHIRDNGNDSCDGINEDLINSDNNEKPALSDNILCNICNKRFPSNVSFRRHMNYHKLAKTKCPLCPKEFAHKSNLKRHLLTHSNKKPLNCDKCGKNFTESTALYDHLKIHKNEEIDREEYLMECDLCGEQTTSYAIFLTHMKSKHNVQKVKPFVCRICGMRFTSKQGMYRHVDNIHENNRRNLRNRDKNFLCTTCGKSFYTNFHLDVHIRSHTGERPYKCQHCNKAFSQFSGLKMHTFTHTGEKPFTCKICGKAFNQYGHVREHMMTHTDQRPHVCKICNHSFRVKGNLTAHMMIHTGKKPYTCQLCGKRFGQSSKLKQHMDKSHS